MRCAWRWRCPHCRKGPLFARWLRVRRECPVCGLQYYRESGYFVGAMLVNYGVTAALLVLFYFALLPVPDFTHFSGETKIALWLAFCVVLSLLLIRHSYSFWIAFDYWLEPWQPEPTPDWFPPPLDPR